MGQLIVSFLVVLHLTLRGVYTVRTTVTPIEYKYKHTLRLQNGSTRTIVWRCRQHKHRVKSNRWYILTQTHYTYGVEMISIDDATFVDYHIAHYPHMCSWVLAKSTFPHRCAINAHLDALHQHHAQ